MRDAATVLEIIRERGRKGLPLERVYRCLFNPDLFLLQGPGVVPLWCEMPGLG